MLLEMFARLHPHMLTKERGTPEAVPRYTAERLGTGILDMPSNVTVTDDTGPEYFRPGGRDPLFWCFQVAQGEAHEGEGLEERSFQREQGLKAEAVAKLREVTEARTEGARRKLAEAEAELCARQFTRGNGLEALARAYSLPVLYVSGHTCCAMGPPVSDGVYRAIIRRVGSRNSRRHEVLTGVEVGAQAAKTLAAAWLMESWAKPLRGVSTYTVRQLRGMAQKAGLPHLRAPDAEGKRLRKADLYAALGALSSQN